MSPTLRRYWVTLRLDPGRTADIALNSTSEWAAGWLARQLHSDLEVLMVRPCTKQNHCVDTPTDSLPPLRP